MIDGLILLQETGIWNLWESYLAFMAIVVMTIAGIGLGSKSLAVGAYLGYLAFAYLTIQSGGPFLMNILYVTLVLVFVGFAFKFWRLEGLGE